MFITYELILMHEGPEFRYAGGAHAFTMFLYCLLIPANYLKVMYIEWGWFQGPRVPEARYQAHFMII